MSDQRYPLSWPSGWARTKYRQPATFRTSREVTVEGSTVRESKRLSVTDAIRRLSQQMTLLGATNEVLSTNIPTRLDGLPRAGQPEPSDPGAAVYFKLNGKPRALACDKWDRVADNIAAIAQHVDAIRRIDRYGVGTIEQAFAGYTALPPSADDWRAVFGLNGGATLDAVEAKYRELARTCHPDVGGDPLQMARLNTARDAARKELTA